MNLSLFFALYSGVNKDVSAQTGNPSNGLGFSADGTKMYAVGTSTIYEYDLSTAWLVSSATYNSVNKSVSAQTTAPRNIAFKSDGTKLYVITQSGADIYEYDLSTAWLLSSATYNSVTIDVTTQSANPRGITFNADGTKMYVGDSNNDTVFEYDLSTAWLVSSATYNSVSLVTGGQAAGINSIAFNSDGTKLFVLDNNADIFEYDLSTAWLLSSATYNSVTKDLALVTGTPRAVIISSSSSKMFIIDNSHIVYEFVFEKIALIGTSSNPTDNSTNAADPTAVTPPAGMVLGDLVCMFGQQKDTSVSLAISEAGGQSWTTEAASGTTSQTRRMFWCIFNGTWGANPSVDFTTAVRNSVQMFVFRALSPLIWSVNQAQQVSSDASSPFNITGQTTTGDNPTVTLAGWSSADSNQYSGPTGAGWAQCGAAQYRNSSISGQSASYAYKIQSAAGATGDVSKTQTSVGPDTTATSIITFEAMPPSPAIDILSITGQVPALQFNLVVSPAVKSVNLSGQIPVALVAYKAVPAVGALAFTGQAPALKFSLVASPAVGNLAFTGQTPVPVITNLASVPVGSLSFTGQLPTVGVSYKFDITSGAISITGQTPNRVADTNRTPATGVLALTGQAPASNQSYTLSPAIDTLAFSGQTPVAVQNIIKQPAVETLAFTGQAPSLTAVIQEGYRWRNDDGTEVTATWRQSQDTTDTTIYRGLTVRLRFVVDSAGNPLSNQLQLEYRKVGTSDWDKVS